MNRLTRYLVAPILGFTAIVGLALVAIYTFISFVAEMDETGQGGFGVGELLYYSLMMMPAGLYVLMPLVAMLGTLLGGTGPARLVVRGCVEGLFLPVLGALQLDPVLATVPGAVEQLAAVREGKKIGPLQFPRFRDLAPMAAAWLVSIRYSDSGVVMRMSVGRRVKARRSSAGVSPERMPTAMSGTGRSSRCARSCCPEPHRRIATTGTLRGR